MAPSKERPNVSAATTGSPRTHSWLSHAPSSFTYASPLCSEGGTLKRPLVRPLYKTHMEPNLSDGSLLRKVQRLRGHRWEAAHSLVAPVRAIEELHIRVAGGAL